MIPGPPVTFWLPQLHVPTVGWITQLIFGAAYWLFPRPTPDEWGPYAVRSAYGLLNLGLLLRLVGEPGVLPNPLQSWGLVVSAGLQWAASLLLVGYFWRRVRPK